jgi:hypothetical protein
LVERLERAVKLAPKLCQIADRVGFAGQELRVAAGRNERVERLAGDAPRGARRLQRLVVDRVGVEEESTVLGEVDR